MINETIFKNVVTSIVRGNDEYKNFIKMLDYENLLDLKTLLGNSIRHGKYDNVVGIKLSTAYDFIEMWCSSKLISKWF